MQDAFTQGYIECAVWAETDDEGTPLDSGEYELANETLGKMEADCADFQHNYAALLNDWYEAGESEGRAGHDFWLTRNGHGAGFWDRFNADNPAAKLGDALSQAARSQGACELYVGDDGLIYYC